MALPTLTDCVARVLFDHIDKIGRGTGLIPQFGLRNLTTTLAGKAPFALNFF